MNDIFKDGSRYLLIFGPDPGISFSLQGLINPPVYELRKRINPDYKSIFVKHDFISIELLQNIFKPIHAIEIYHPEENNQLFITSTFYSLTIVIK